MDFYRPVVWLGARRAQVEWDFLFADPDTNKDDLFEISRIMTESE